jgi:Cu+-exporting ATPase
MAGTGKGAEKGLLFRNSEALERAARLDTIVLDKTGTITLGKPVVADVVVHNPAVRDEEELLKFGASVERGSEHPLGRAVVREAEDRGISLLEPECFKAFRGLGVRGRIEGREVLVGKPRWFLETGLSLDGASDQVQALQDQGKTVMVVAVDRKIAGLIAVADQVKPESKEAINALRKQKLKVTMLTGDNEKTARAIASELGIDDLMAEVRPEEKSNKVKALMESGRAVGMVGDGINDAPALAQADVGLAIGTGTDVAIETGDIILASGSLTGVSRAIHLSRATMRTIRQNLFWAFFYNVILIPVAAGVLYPLSFLPLYLRQLHPILAALAMAMSSISVVSNSLRLYRARIE